jgi:hypothetical protein
VNTNNALTPHSTDSNPITAQEPDCSSVDLPPKGPSVRQLRAKARAEARAPATFDEAGRASDPIDDEILREYHQAKASAHDMVLHAYRCGVKAIQKQKEVCTENPKQ